MDTKEVRQKGYTFNWHVRWLFVPFKLQCFSNSMKNANVYKLCDVDLEVTSMKTEIKINVDIAFLHPVRHDSYSMPSRNQYENKLCI